MGRRRLRSIRSRERRGIEKSCNPNRHHTFPDRSRSGRGRPGTRRQGNARMGPPPRPRPRTTKCKRGCGSGADPSSPRAARFRACRHPTTVRGALSRGHVRCGSRSPEARRVENPPLELHEVRRRGLCRGLGGSPTGSAASGFARLSAGRTMPRHAPSPGTGEGVRSQAQGEGGPAHTITSPSPMKPKRR